MQLMKADIMQPIETVLKSVGQEELISVLQVVLKLAFACDTVAQKMLTKDVLKSLKSLCAHKNPEASSLLPSHNILVLISSLVLYGRVIFKVYLSLGTKVSSVSCWEFGLLFGEPPYSGYF
jgi:hypothetical protein